jgi:hypothetical protein
MEDKKNWVSYFIIGTFVTLYLLVSIISTIHVVEFFELSNPQWLAISLAVAFEVGAAASLASLIALKKMNKGLVWMLFILLTAMQAMGNTYYAYVNLTDFTAWSELFGLIEEELIYQKRVLSLVSGAVLPIVALGFIKSLVDYIKPEETELLAEIPKEIPTEGEEIDGGNSSVPEIEVQPLNEPQIEKFTKEELLLDVSTAVKENIPSTSVDNETISSANSNKTYTPVEVVELPTAGDADPTRIL